MHFGNFPFVAKENRRSKGLSRSSATTKMKENVCHKRIFVKLVSISCYPADKGRSKD